MGYDQVGECYRYMVSSSLNEYSDGTFLGQKFTLLATLCKSLPACFYLDSTELRGRMMIHTFG